MLLSENAALDVVFIGIPVQGLEGYPILGTSSVVSNFTFEDFQKVCLLLLPNSYPDYLLLKCS